MWGTRTYLIGCAAAVLVACGGSEPPPSAPEPSAPEPEPAASMTAPASAPSEADEEAPGAKQDKPDDGDKPKSDVPEPAFKDGMSVNDAINAVPQGVERVNVDEETLGKPLQSFDVYAPCKPRPNEHFKIKVAIWDGKAVGVDVHTTPDNKKLTACIDKQIRSLSWKDPVKSLNTVEYAF